MEFIEQSGASRRRVRAWSARRRGVLAVAAVLAVVLTVVVAVISGRGGGGREPRVLAAPPSFPERLVFSPDGRMLAAVVQAGTVRMWDLRTGRPTFTLPTASTDRSPVVAFSRDFRTLAVAGPRGVTLLDIPTWRSRRTIATGPYIDALAFDPGGTTLAAFDRRRRQIRLWDLTADTSSGFTTGDYADSVDRLAYTPDGGTLLSDGDQGPVLWGLPAGRPYATFMEGSQANALSPDGQILAAGDYRTPVRLWNITDIPPAVVQTLPTTAQVLAVSPDGKTIAVAGDTSLTLWNLKSRRLTLVLPTHIGSDSISALAYSPDGTTLAAGHQGGILLWRLH